MVFTALSPKNELPDERDRTDAGGGDLVQLAVVSGQERAAHAIRERDAVAIGERNAAPGLQLPGLLPERLVEVRTLDDAQRPEVIYRRVGSRLVRVLVDDL